MLLDSVPTDIVSNEFVEIQRALGRVLTRDVEAKFDMPEYDKTFFDGYAINDKDTKSASIEVPVNLKIVKELFPADYPTDAEIAHGEAIYVATGAPIPKGATATIKVEETRKHNGIVEVCRPVKVGEGIIPFGDDVRRGTVVLKERQVLRPQDIGFLASLGMTHVEVIKKPKIAIISGGDELIKQKMMTPEKIVNNYALVVAGLASELGGDPELRGIANDTLEDVKRLISSALEDSDIVVTIGGCSMGKKDFVPDAINALGKPGVIVQGVLLGPGAVSGFGLVKEKPVVILPGNIGGCIAGFFLFVVPLIGIYCGLGKANVLPCLKTKLKEDYETRAQYRFALMNVKQEQGEFWAVPVDGVSGALVTLIKANGFAIIPPKMILRKGDTIDTFLFSRQELAQVL
jgi:molybdenum cofactor synthesis domain-containing protein